MKRSYEERYPEGYFITKRGEDAPANRDSTLVVDLLDLGKYMIAWHSQRPNISYSENKIFDKHFDQLFSKSREYAPENVYALSHWMQEVRKRWKKDNPLALNESLLAMQSYAPYHHLYAVSLCFCVANSIGQDVPDPVIAYKKASSADLVGQIVDISGASLNTGIRGGSK